MSNHLTEQHIACRKCRYRFPVPAQVHAEENWKILVQCPSCDGREHFAEEDTRDSAPVDLQVWETELQRHGEQLWQPIDEHRVHPAVAWLNRVGNGLLEDDHSKSSWPVPCWVYKFRRREEAAYIWEEHGAWHCRHWHPLRVRRKPPEPVKCSFFKESLELLVH